MFTVYHVVPSNTCHYSPLKEIHFFRGMLLVSSVYSTIDVDSVCVSVVAELFLFLLMPLLAGVSNVSFGGMSSHHFSGSLK